MTFSRRLGASAALAFTLLLGACSTPADVAVPGLEAQFGAGYDDRGTHVTVGPNASVYVLSSEGAFQTETSGQRPDLRLKRYDNNGKILWDKVVSTRFGCSDLKATGLGVDSSGRASVSYTVHDCEDDRHAVVTFSASGSKLNDTWFWSGNEVNSVVFDSAGNNYVTTDYDVSKYAVKGSSGWSQPTWSTIGDAAEASVGTNGNVYAVGPNGVIRYDNATGSAIWKIPGAATDIVAFGTGAVYVRNLATIRKLDANGKQLWSRAQTGLSGMVVADMTTDSSGNLYLVGKYNASSTNRNVFVRKLNPSGGVVFTKTFGTALYDDALGVATVTGAAVYVTGATKGALAHPYRGGDTDGYLAKLGGTGTPIWTR